MDDEVEMLPAADGAWQEGNFAFFFFYMGQGNCCLVVCPDKRLIVIDCGSMRKYPAETTGTIRDRIIMYNPDRQIDFLIITHPDRDHYNKIVTVFDGFTIDTIIVSLATNDSPLYRYYTNSVSQEIYYGSIPVNTIREVTINPDKKSLRTWNAPGFKNPSTTAIAEPFYTVCNGIAKDTDWSVQIIAGNVGYNEDNVGPANAWDINSASLVTLCTLGDQKYINPGDATELTENFMIKPARIAAIQNVQLALISHHGSNDHTNTPAYVNALNAQNAFVSVQNQEKVFFVPKTTSMNLYQNVPGFLSNMPVHPTDSWVLADDYSPGSSNQADVVKQGWINSGTPYSQRGNFYFLNDIPAEGGCYAVYPLKGMMLMRTITTQNIINNGTSYGAGQPMISHSFSNP